MEENIVNNNKNKKKIIIGSIAIILLLLVVVIGSTYAYFTMGVQNVSEDTEITIKTGDKNNITLTGGVTNYKLHVDNDDMAKNKVNAVYYGTISESKNYETNEEDATITIGNIETDGELVDDYTCNATINIVLEGNMKDKLQENDLVVVIIQGETETTIDLSKDITEPSISFDLKNIEPIKAYVKLTNQDKDQSGLEGKELNLEINVSGFRCELNKGTPPLEMLTSTTSEDYLKTVAEDDELLRYVGTQEDVTAGRLNNYICFGTYNQETCLGDKETYMYRIIGITTENVNQELGLVSNQLKIIQAYPKDSISGIAWNSDSDSNITWNSASVQTEYLNGTFLTSITGTVGTHQWSDLISNPKWYIVDNRTSPWTLTVEEDKTTFSTNYKVGLLYASDYYDGCNKSPNTNCWLYVKNGLSTSASLSGNSTSLNEWTMSRFGYVSHDNYYYAWVVGSNGGLTLSDLTATFTVRPVFYLIPNITLTGEGTESNPFIIGEV